MSRLAALAVFHLSFMTLFPDAVFCQIRVTPAKSLGGEKPSELWAEMPTEFRRSITLPKWPVPDDLESWKTNFMDGTVPMGHDDPRRAMPDRLFADPR